MKFDVKALVLDVRLDIAVIYLGKAQDLANCSPDIAIFQVKFI